MKRLLFIFSLACVLLSGCIKDGDTYTLRASSEVKTRDAKTHLDPDIDNEMFDVIWDPTDEIIVYDDGGNGSVFTNEDIYDDDNNQVAHFRGTVSSTSTFYSFYPVSIANGSDSYTLPTTQSYKARSDGYVAEYPMYSQEDGNSNHLYFRNLCGLAILRIKAPTNATIRNVIMREPNDPYSIYNGIAGTFTVSCDGSTRTHVPTTQITDPEFQVTLNCTANPQTLTDGKMLYYIYVPQSIHRWLIIGIDYKRSGSSTWETAYTTIYATSYGRSYFSFVRNQWCAIDVDFSNVNPNEIYNVEDVVFDPDDIGTDTVINTGVKITESYDNYTFLIDVTPSNISNPSTYQRAIFSEMDYGSPWNGVLIRIDGYRNTSYNDGTYGNIACYQFVVGTNRIKGPAAYSGTRQKFVCTLNTSQNKISLYWMEGNTLKSTNTTVSASQWITTADPTPQVGGDQHKVDRYFSGTVHQLSIYDRLFSTNEIRTWLNN